MNRKQTAERSKFNLTESSIGGQAEIDAIIDAVRNGKCCRLIGPRYHHKSRLMREACAQIALRLGSQTIYTSLRTLRFTSEREFYFALYDTIARQVARQTKRRFAKTTIRSSADLTSFLSSLPKTLHANVALFTDDLELDVVPPEYLRGLLQVLRAAYLNTVDALQFVAVVCASHSLARTALGPTSPFENISNLVILSDLSRADTFALARELVAPDHFAPTLPALDLIYAQTAGDPFLIDQVSKECCKLIRAAHANTLTRPIVQAALDNLVRRGGQGAVAEGIQHIENDPYVLRAILTLLQQDQVAANELALDLTEVPDPLVTSGFVTKQNNRYRIKSPLHDRLLKHALSDERLGRIFLAAGDLDQATRYLRGNGRATADEAEGRSRIVLSFISAMYSARDKQLAFAQLAHALEIAYPKQSVYLYDYVEKKQALVLIHASIHNSKTTRLPTIPFALVNRPEIKALHAPHDYSWRVMERGQRTLFIPLRVVESDNLGLVVVEKLVTPKNFHRQEEHLLELIGYLRYAARALKNHQEFERLNQQAERRAKDLQHLLRVTQELMRAQGSFHEVLEQVLISARKALQGRAQIGSIWIYHPDEGVLKMDADSGYPAAIKNTLRFRPGDGAAGYAYSQGRLWNVADTAHDSHFVPPPRDMDPQIRSSIGVPLLGRRGTLGVLFLDNVRHINAFDLESEQLLTIFAGQVALWLERVRLLEGLRYKRDIARLAAELVHQITGAVASIPELSDEISDKMLRLAHPMEAQDLVLELRDKATDLAHIGKWLNKFLKVGGMLIESFNVAELVEEVCRRVANRVPPHITLRQQALLTMPCALSADRALISILLENLIENAIEAIQFDPAAKANESSTIDLQFDCQDNFCIIHVVDNGPGIPLEYQEQIWQMGWTTKPGDGAGHGLGLPLCRHIVVAHEGTIHLQDSAIGTHFMIRLPLKGPETEIED